MLSHHAADCTVDRILYFRVVGTIAIVVIIAGGERGDEDTRGFMIGSPNVTGWLILDDLARVSCCEGAANVNP
jgi:hypothetical protein